MSVIVAGDTFGQSVGIANTNITPDPESILDIRSSSKGVLLPRMTSAERVGIPTAAAADHGLTVYDTTTGSYWYWNGTSWQEIPNVANTGNTLDEAYDEGGPGAGRIINATNGNVEITGAGFLTVASNVGIGTTGPDRRMKISGTGWTALEVENTDNQDAAIELTSQSVSNYVFTDNTGFLGLESAAGQPIVLRTDGANERVVVQTDGRLRVNNLADPNFAVVLSSNTGVLGKVALTGNATDVLLGTGSFGPSSAFADHDWYKVTTTVPPANINDNIYTQGRVGIGINNPSVALDVSGSAYVGSGESRFWNGTYTDPHSGTPYAMKIVGTAGAGSIAASGNVVVTSGNLGVGTTGPSQKMQITVDNNGLNIPIFVRNLNGTMTGGNGAGIGFNSEAGGDWIKTAVFHERTTNYGVGKLHFLVDNAADNGSVTLSESRMTIQPDGNVGVGTTIPSQKFEVIGTGRFSSLAAGGNVQSNANGDLIISNDLPGGDGDYIQNQTAAAQSGNGFYTSGSGRANGTLTGGGSTVISTDNIQINDLGSGNRYAYVDFEGDDTYTDYALRIIRNNGGANTSSQIIHRGSGDLNLTTADVAAMTFSTANSERVRITPVGNVGIGITGPGAKLTVRTGGTDPSTYDDGKVLFASGAFGSGQSYDGGIEFRHDNLTQGVGIGYNTIYQTGTNPNEVLNLIAKGTGNITLNAYGGASGNVGVGTVGPLEKLHVNGSLRVEDGQLNTGVDNLRLMEGVRADDNSYEWVGFYSGSTRQGIILYDGQWSGANNVTNEFGLTAENGNLLTLNTSGNHIALMPDGSGNVGIGTLSPSHRLHITGNNSSVRIEGTGSYGSQGKFNFGDGNYVYLEETTDDHLTVEARNGARIGDQGTYTKDVFHGTFTVGDNNANNCPTCIWSGWSGNELEIQVSWANLGIPDGTSKTVMLMADGNNNSYSDTWNVALQTMFSNRMDILIDRTNGGGWGLTTLRIHYIIMNND